MNWSVVMAIGSVLAMTAASTMAQEVTASRSTLYDRPVHVLDNGLVRLSVTPEIGGRVLEFALVSTGSNVAKVRLDNFHRKPTDAWVGADYGGFSDAATAGWPGPMWGVMYDVSVADASDGGKSLVLVGEADGVRVRRTMTLRPSSTLLDIAIEQTNTAPEPRNMIVRLHCEQGAGPLPDEEDFIYWRSAAKGLQSIRYIYGAEYERFAWLDVTDGWVAGIDRRAAEGFVRLFEPRDQPQRVFYWCGYNEDPTNLGLSGAFFGLDRFGKEQPVAPGASLSAREQMFLVRGIRRADFTSGTIVGALEIDRDRYGAADDQLSARVVLAGAESIGEHAAELRVLQGAKELLKQNGPIPASAAGQAAAFAHAWPLPNLADGSYTVEATVRTTDGQVIGRAARQFEVIGELVRAAQQAVRQYSEMAKALESAAPSSDRPLWLATELKVAQLRTGQLAELMQQGDYEQAIADSKHAIAEIEASLNRLGKR